MNIALIGGAGEGLGAALGRRFSKTHEVVLSSRTQGERADLREESQVIALFDRIEKRGPVEVAIFNAGANFRASILDTPAEMFEKVWRLGCYAGFLFGREAARRMLPRERGTILFTGATASLRARPPFTAFASAKAALRAVAHGMAREFGPQGLHVGHVIIDGMIDGDQLNTRFPELRARMGEDGMLAVDAIADAYWALHTQQRSAWTLELDLRPYKETF